MSLQVLFHLCRPTRFKNELSHRWSIQLEIVMVSLMNRAIGMEQRSEDGECMHLKDD